MNTLTTEILKENIVEILPSIGANDSFFSKVGVRNITTSNVDLIRAPKIGNAGIVFEGQPKPDTVTTVIDSPVIRFKSVASIPVSKEFQLDSEGGKLLEVYLEQGAKALIDAPAVALLTGLDLNSGTKIPGLADYNLYDNGLAIETETTTDALVASATDAAFANGQMGGKMVIDDTYWRALAGPNAPSLPGGRLFPEMTTPSDFDFMNTKGGFVYGKLAEANTYLDKELLSVVGPFADNVGVSIVVNDVKVFHEQWKDQNLASTNIDMYVLEADVAMWVQEPEKFNVVKAA